MRILVTGGAGLIGHHLVAYLEQFGHQVCVLDTFTQYGCIPDAEIAFLKAYRLGHIRGQINTSDIRDRLAVEGLYQGFQPDLCIHLASFPRQKVVAAQPAQASSVMIEGLMTLLEAHSRYCTGRFVNISSSMVYGNFASDIDEDAPCNPLGQYGILKLAGEQLVRDYGQRQGLDYTIVRPSVVYGEGDTQDRVISHFMRAALQGETLKVMGAHEVLDFSYVGDVARGIAQAALSPNAHQQTYNITRSAPHLYTLLDAAKLAVAIVGSGQIECLNRDPSFPQRGRLSIAKARRDFGYQPSVDLPEGLRRYGRWLAASPFVKFQQTHESLVDEAIG